MSAQPRPIDPIVLIPHSLDHLHGRAKLDEINRRLDQARQVVARYEAERDQTHSDILAEHADKLGELLFDLGRSEEGGESDDQSDARVFQIFADAGVYNPSDPAPRTQHWQPTGSLDQELIEPQFDRSPTPASDNGDPGDADRWDGIDR